MLDTGLFLIIVLPIIGEVLKIGLLGAIVYYLAKK